MGADRAVDVAVPPQLVLRIEAVGFDVHLGAIEQAVIIAARVVDHQLGGIGVAHQEVAVEQSLVQDLAGDGQEQRAIGAGLDRHPLVGDGRIAGAHRIDRDEASAAPLELGDGDLERIGMMVLGSADHHEQLGALQIRAAELPERTADGVDETGGHVDRAETAMRGIVGRAVLLGEQAGERLHLIAAGEEREFFRIFGTQLGEPLFEHSEGFVPGDDLEGALAALGAGFAPQRLGESTRRVLLHDPRAALGADHALVQRMIGVAVDVAHLAIAQMHPDTAPASAHVTGRLLDLDATDEAVRMTGWILHGGTFRGG